MTRQQWLAEWSPCLTGCGRGTESKHGYCGACMTRKCRHCGWNVKLRNPTYYAEHAHCKKQRLRKQHEYDSEAA